MKKTSLVAACFGATLLAGACNNRDLATRSDVSETTDAVRRLGRSSNVDKAFRFIPASKFKKDTDDIEARGKELSAKGIEVYIYIGPDNQPKASVYDVGCLKENKIDQVPHEPCVYKAKDRNEETNKKIVAYRDKINEYFNNYAEMFILIEDEGRAIDRLVSTDMRFSKLSAEFQQDLRLTAHALSQAIAS